MAMTLITFSKLTVPALALAATFLGSTEDGVAQTTETLSCEIAVTDGHFGPVYQGVVTATQAVSGQYQMKVRKTGANSASVNQSGFFMLSEGETATVGQASMGGSGQIDAKLVLKFDGQQMTCVTAGAHDL